MNKRRKVKQHHHSGRWTPCGYRILERARALRRLGELMSEHIIYMSNRPSFIGHFITEEKGVYNDTSTTNNIA